MAPKTNTFSTDTEQFDEDYKENAHLQRGFNKAIINDFVQYVIRTIQQPQTRPIKILDLCCGDGGITAALLKLLQENKVSVEKIVGYDISRDQIKVAKRLHGNDDLDFRVQDIVSMTDENEFDFVISLFGLHWIKDLGEVAEKIHRALKPEGKLMYFVPLEKNNFFALRKNMVASEEWQSHFDNYQLVPFISEPKQYTAFFKPYFDSENDEVSGTETVKFDRKKFMEFLSSWMPEVRHLQDQEDKSKYLLELLRQIPAQKDKGSTSPESVPCDDKPDVERTPDKSQILFHERLFWYHGQKRQSSAPSADGKPLELRGSF